MPKFRHKPRFDAIAYCTAHPTTNSLSRYKSNPSLFTSERLVKWFVPAGEPRNLDL
jgi:hypothetical protein